MYAIIQMTAHLLLGGRKDPKKSETPLGEEGLMKSHQRNESFQLQLDLEN